MSYTLKGKERHQVAALQQGIDQGVATLRAVLQFIAHREGVERAQFDFPTMTFIEAPKPKKARRG